MEQQTEGTKVKYFLKMYVCATRISWFDLSYMILTLLLEKINRVVVLLACYFLSPFLSMTFLIFLCYKPLAIIIFTC